MVVVILQHNLKKKIRKIQKKFLATIVFEIKIFFFRIVL